MKRPWKNSLIANFFLSYLIVVLLLFVAFHFYSGAVVKDFTVSFLAKKMQQEAKILTRLLPDAEETESLDAISRSLAQDLGVRITIIAQDGKVLGDSGQPSAGMENHGDRPEVREAISSGQGRSIRYSTTVGYEMLYLALRQDTEDQPRIIRLSVPLDFVQERIGDLRRAILFGFLMVSTLGLLLAWLFSRRLGHRIARMAAFSQEVARGETGWRSLEIKGEDELSILERNLNEMNQTIREKIETLTAEKEKRESILRCMIEGVLVIDRQGQLILINERARNMFRLPGDVNYEGNPVSSVSRHPEMKRLFQEVMACDCSKECFTKEISFDDVTTFRVNAVSLSGQDDRPLGYVLVFHDVTELKRLETMRSDFVANVSHELRTPLSAIKGYAETLLMNPPKDNATSRQFLEVINRHSERLGRLIDDLLTLSDLERGTLPLAKEEIHVDPLIERVIEIFRNQAANKSVALFHSIEANLPPVLGDGDRLQQLLINLIDNALKYTPKSGRVEISAKRASREETRSSDMIEITVADTGFGIPERDLPRLTERFYRVDKARSRELGGTGLGLAIVKHIVQAHGGLLKIESAIQIGTTVRVFLPFVTDLKKGKGILFLCTANSCRSQMAEGFARTLAPDEIQVHSAGTAPKAVHPLAIRVMKEVGIDISAQRAKGLNDVPLDEIDLTITLCGEAAESCPTFPKKTDRIHWPLPDPALAQGDEESVLRTFRQVRDEIQSRVRELFADPLATST